MDVTVANHIESSPDLSSGRPRIAGTRVRVQDIVACYEFQGMTPDEIVAGYPHITLAAVHAALAYYHDHRDEIRGHMKQDEAFSNRFRNQSLIAKHGTAADANTLSPR